jgi:hypothetical protein
MDELPLRVYDQPGGAVVRCLCGLELARMRKGVEGGRLMARTTGMNRGQVQLGPDVTTPGLLAMVVHASACKTGRALLAEMSRVWSGM